MPTKITPFEVRRTAIVDLYVIQMKQVRDERGVVREFYRESAFRDADLPALGPWLQVNVTESRHGAIRGLHGESMFKLVGIVSGEAFGAYVDSRPDSASFGAVHTERLRPGTQVLVPKGVCNGFQSGEQAADAVPLHLRQRMGRRHGGQRRQSVRPRARHRVAGGDRSLGPVSALREGRRAAHARRGNRPLTSDT